MECTLVECNVIIFVYTLIEYTLTEYTFRFSNLKKNILLVVYSSLFFPFLHPPVFQCTFSLSSFLLTLLYLGQTALLVTLYTMLWYLCVSLGSNSRFHGTSLVCYHWATLIDRILQWIYFYICYILQINNYKTFFRHYSIIIYRLYNKINQYHYSSNLQLSPSLWNFIYQSSNTITIISINIF